MIVPINTLNIEQHIIFTTSCRERINGQDTIITIIITRQQAQEDNNHQILYRIRITVFVINNSMSRQSQIKDRTGTSNLFHNVHIFLSNPSKRMSTKLIKTKQRSNVKVHQFLDFILCIHQISD